MQNQVSELKKVANQIKLEELIFYKKLGKIRFDYTEFKCS